MNRPRLTIWQRYARVMTAVTLVVLAVVGIGLIGITNVMPLPQRWGVVTDSTGASVLASVLVCALVSVFLEPARQEVQVRAAIDYTTKVALDQFHSRFELLLPKATFEASDMPKSSFRDSFATLMDSSSRYYLKATSANFTTFRLYKLKGHPKMNSLDIRVCLLDPRADAALRAHATHQLHERREISDPAAITAEMNRIREDVFVSVVALFDIRHSLRTTVYFHSDLPFFRNELFDGGMFLTYYLGWESRPESYPATLEFADRSQPYKAYKYSLGVTMDNSPYVLRLESAGSSKDSVKTEEELRGRRW